MADFYTQCPNMLIFGLPDLSSNDRMVMLSLIYLTWGNEEPLQISMRDLAKFNHISPSVLCDSAKNEQEKQKQVQQGKFREGSLTRLSNHGYITVEEIDGKTYITVHLQKIWDDNAAFRKQKGVPNSNTIKSRGVRKSNTSALNSNSEIPSSVRKSNSPVLNSNTDNLQDSYTGVSSDHLRTDNNLMKERKNESESTHIVSENSQSDSPEASFHSSIHSPALSSGYAEIWLKDFLLAIGEYSNRKKHACRLVEIYANYNRDDTPTFRAKVDAAIYSARLATDPIETFFDYLGKQL